VRACVRAQSSMRAFSQSRVLRTNFVDLIWNGRAKSCNWTKDCNRPISQIFSPKIKGEKRRSSEWEKAWRWRDASLPTKPDKPEKAWSSSPWFIGGFVELFRGQKAAIGQSRSRKGRSRKEWGAMGLGDGGNASHVFLFTFAHKVASSTKSRHQIFHCLVFHGPV
jgi:hypothetical protein